MDRQKKSITTARILISILCVFVILFSFKDEDASAAGKTISDPIVGNKKDFTDLKLGEIGKQGDAYIGLQYVKKMSYCPVALGLKGKVKKGREVILAFFEFYNGGKSECTVHPENISCYADKKLVKSVKKSLRAEVDGVTQYYSESLDPTCQMVCVEDFDVPEGWKQLQFFYNSECVWTISNKDVKEDDYSDTSLFNIPVNRKVTKKNAVIYSDGYKVRFKGFKTIRRKDIFSDPHYYAIFKFRITNNSKVALRLYEDDMRLYQNNIYVGTADDELEDTLGGYINICYASKIEPGMTGDVYVAFDIKEIPGSLYMIFDDGNWDNKTVGEVFVNIEG